MIPISKGKMSGPDDLPGFLFKDLDRTLGLCREMSERVSNNYIAQRHAFVKGYVENKLCAVCQFKACGYDGQYEFVFHRIPFQLRHSEAATATMHCTNESGEDTSQRGRSEGQVKGVLPVGYLGQFSDKVIASGVTITSGVWLQRAKRWPKFWGDFGVGRSGLLANSPQAVFEVDWRVGPREVDGFLRRLPNGRKTSVGRLVETVADMGECLGGAFSDDRRKPFDQNNLMDFLSRIFVYIDDAFEGVSFEEGPALGIVLLDSFLSPTECLASAGEGL